MKRIFFVCVEGSAKAEADGGGFNLFVVLGFRFQFFGTQIGEIVSSEW